MGLFQGWLQGFLDGLLQMALILKSWEPLQELIVNTGAEYVPFDPSLGPETKP